MGFYQQHSDQCCRHVPYLIAALGSQSLVLNASLVNKSVESLLMIHLFLISLELAVTAPHGFAVASEGLKNSTSNMT